MAVGLNRACFIFRRGRSMAMVVGVCGALLAAPSSSAAPPIDAAACGFSWNESRLFEISGVEGNSNRISAMILHDDGNGSALYAGGEFNTLSGSPSPKVGRWDGRRWTPLGAGLVGGDALALASFDDGTGPALYVGGNFTVAGGVHTPRLARWKNGAWSSVGLEPSSSVLAMTVFDDGSGPALFVGGSFTQIGGINAAYIAKWDGRTWSALGAGLSNAVTALLPMSTPQGPALCVGGVFASAGGQTANHIARWRAGAWETMGGGMNGHVYALANYDDGGGEKLYAAGQFAFASGLPARNVARWDGSAWSAIGNVGSGGGDYVRSMAVFRHNGQASLCIGGDFNFVNGMQSSHITRWDGSTFHALAGGVQQDVYSMVVFNDGFGERLYVGGDFSRYFLKWTGTQWFRPGHGVNAPVNALAVFHHDHQPALFAAGNFSTAGEARLNCVSRWSPEGWQSMDNGMDAQVNTLAVAKTCCDQPARLFAAGGFFTAGGTPAQRIAMWENDQWQPLAGGQGPDGEAYCMTEFDDGTGPALYVGGGFDFAGNVAANNIAKWDGTTWTALGDGLNFDVLCMAAFDGPNGPELYVGGSFSTAGGVPARNIARWNGKSWQSVGGEFAITQQVETLYVFDDGSGPAVYAGGGFNTAGGVTCNKIARWNGAAWSAVGTGFDHRVASLTSFDDGVNGPRLVAGGYFMRPFGQQTLTFSIAQFDGVNWLPFGGGISGHGQFIQGEAPCVLALASFNGDGGPALFAGGMFWKAGGGQSHCIARWAVPTTTIVDHPADITVPAGVPAVFSITAEGAAPMSYQWMKGGRMLIDDPHISGSTTSRLTIGATTAADTGEYSAMVVSACGSATSSTARLDVISACLADIMPDGTVNVQDLLAVIGAWGSCANPNNCPADIAPIGPPIGNDVVNVQDLLAVIGAWGTCP